MSTASEQEASKEHRIATEACSARIQIEVDGEIIADTREALALHETRCPVRYYIPQRDVRKDLLETSDTSTRCPYKGEASYWHLQLGERVIEDIAWGYLEPTAHREIEGLLSFYPGKVDRFRVDGKELTGRS